MDLDSYLGDAHGAESRLAESVGCAPSTIHRARHGDRTVSLNMALAIEGATGRRVRAEELPLTAQTRKMVREMRGRERKRKGRAA